MSKTPYFTFSPQLAFCSFLIHCIGHLLYVLPSQLLSVPRSQSEMVRCSTTKRVRPRQNIITTLVQLCVRSATIGQVLTGFARVQKTEHGATTSRVNVSRDKLICSYRYVWNSPENWPLLYVITYLNVFLPLFYKVTGVFCLLAKIMDTTKNSAC